MVHGFTVADHITSHHKFWKDRAILRVRPIVKNCQRHRKCATGHLLHLLLEQVGQQQGGMGMVWGEEWPLLVMDLRWKGQEVGWSRTTHYSGFHFIHWDG